MNLSARLKRISEWTGHAVAWVMIPMVVVQFAVVVLRYRYGLGWIWMQESILWMHAAVFLLASAYTLKRDEHVRVDIFYSRLDSRGRAWVNVGGALILLLPMMIFLVVVSWDYVYTSWSIREGSREAGGLPYPFVPLLKSLIPLTAGLLMLQGIANLLSDLGKALGHDQVADDEAERS